MSPAHEPSPRAQPRFYSMPIQCGKSPAQLLMSRQLRSTLPLTSGHLASQVPDTKVIVSKLHHSKQVSKHYFDKSAKPLKPLHIGEGIRIRNNKRWLPATVQQKVNTRSYIVRTQDGGMYRRNRKHLLKSNEAPFTDSHFQFNSKIPYVVDRPVTPPVLKPTTTVASNPIITPGQTAQNNDNNSSNTELQTPQQTSPDRNQSLMSQHDTYRTRSGAKRSEYKKKRKEKRLVKSERVKSKTMADKNESQSLCSAVNAMILNATTNGTMSEQVNRHNESNIQLESSDLTTDGAFCDPLSPLSSSADLPSPDSLVSKPDSRSTAPLPSFDEMRDFVIVHASKDYENAVEFSEHLYTDAEDETVTVDLLDEIDIGKSKFKSAKSLHDRYRLLLIFVTDEFNSSNRCRHLNEMLLDAGFNDDSKHERVVPVLTKEDCVIDELNIISGLSYFNRIHGTDRSKNSYRKSVKYLIKEARKIKPS